jgi:predicted NACHT family NTPase
MVNKMGRRTLQASSVGIEIIKKAIKRKKWSQDLLAGRVGCVRQTIGQHLYKGDPIDEDYFLAICQELGLDWQEMIVQEAESSSEDDLEIKDLIVDIRQRIEPMVKKECGKMRVLDMEQDIALGEIYTDVNILENLTSTKRLGLEELHCLFNSELADFERLGWGKAQKRVSGLEAVQGHHKLMIWGKPGAGKTTFLKYIAMECLAERLGTDCFPIFLSLKEFAEKPGQPELLHYIKHKFVDTGVKIEVIEKLLNHGKALILLDGLDEVLEKDSRRVISQIQQLADHLHYGKNQFLITCRIAAKEYLFQGFREVEVADFDQEQIQVFVMKWFQFKNPAKAEKFMEKLADNEPIQELASSPLLLTLLCLVFGELTNFPHNRAQLYEEGVDILLKRWDGKRGIERDQLYKNLSAKRKEDLLSLIALETFKQGNYFFKQKTAETYIAQFIENLPDAKSDPEALRLDSEDVLRSIEANHGLLVTRAKGIYSFSHLTFQEYFATRKLTLNPTTETLRELVSHLTEKRWREVILLAVEMLEDATELMQLMKQAVDQLLAEDERLQEYLQWLKAKANSVEREYTTEDIKQTTKRFSYLAYVKSDQSKIRCLYLFHPLSLSQIIFLELDFFLDLCLSLEFDISRFRPISLNLSRSVPLDFYLYFDQKFTSLLNKLPPSQILLKEELQALFAERPDPENKEPFKQWLKKKGKAWTEKLRQLMITHRNIGHDWQFNRQQKDLLKQYRTANILLMECLGREAVIDRGVRAEIENTLFLPISN